MLAGMPDEPDPERVYYKLKPKQFERVNKPVHEEPAGPIEVKAILQQNIEADQSPLPPELKPVPATSRRAKDFSIGLVAAGIICGVPAYLLREDRLAFILAVSGFVFFAVLLFWIFWVLLDRY